MERFNRVPRCDLLKGPEAVGWKGVRGDIDGAFVHWLPDPGIGQAIATAIQVYRQTVRDPIMRIRRHMGLPDHPYLLISARAPAASCGRRLGDPYSMSAFNSSWKRAVSLAYSAENLPIPDIVKRNGLTPHGCRHRYGQKLWDLGLDGAIIQQCMHHVNPFSQLVYTQQPVSKISQRLVEAAAGRATSGMNWGNVGRFLPTSEALLSERDRRHTLK
jgi:integrase